MPRFLLLFALLLPLTAPAKTVYKYYDADGNVVFTDQPVPGAEKFTISEPQVVGSPERAARPMPVLPAMPDADAGAVDLVPYSQFKIRAPTPDQVFRDVKDVLVSLSIMPRLQKGHKVQVYLDGKPVGSPKPSPQFALPGVERGSHTVEARILNEQGRMVVSSGAVSFHMHKTSALNRPAQSDNAPPPRGGMAQLPDIRLPVLPSAQRMPQAPRGARAPVLNHRDPRQPDMSIQPVTESGS
ncbi:MAG: DUF4124 domain-containing protein [Gammaproteobacteria bacterium]|nr:DUF4124 domain-containing protein [Gammaproteobacteria bacterium]